MDMKFAFDDLLANGEALRVSGVQRIVDFQADLRNLESKKILEKYIYSLDCAKLTLGQNEKLRRRVSGKFGVDEQNVVIVGSAKLGFSIAPGKRYREFNDSSDIDVSIISTELYGKIWRELFEFERSGAYWERFKECEHYCFRGWIGPTSFLTLDHIRFRKGGGTFFRR